MAAGFDNPGSVPQADAAARAPTSWRDVLAGAPEVLPLVEGPPASGAERRAPLGVALATVDLERAAGALAGLRFAPAAPDEALGARSMVAPLADGTRLVLLEPAREGRLAAFLARHGEGIAALYVAAGADGVDEAGDLPATAPEAGDLPAAAPEAGPGAVLGGPLGPARLRLPAPRWGPFVLEVMGPPGRSPAR
jgi:hypothetical protein